MSLFKGSEFMKMVCFDLAHLNIDLNHHQKSILSSLGENHFHLVGFYSPLCFPIDRIDDLYILSAG